MSVDKIVKITQKYFVFVMCNILRTTILIVNPTHKETKPYTIILNRSKN